MNRVKINARIFPQGEGLIKALGDESFKKLSASDQVVKLGKLFRDHVSGDKLMSENLMSMIRGATLFAIGNKEFSYDEIMNISPYELELASKLSKRKIAVVRLRVTLGKFYDKLTESQKEELSQVGVDREEYIKRQIREIHKQFSGVPGEIIDTLWNNYDLDFEIKYFLQAFSLEDSTESDSLQEVCMGNGGISPEFFADLGMRLPYLGINTRKIQKELFYQEDRIDRLTGNYLDVSIENKEDAKLDNRNGFINPNWFLYDMDVDSAFKLWGPEKTKYIFGKYFFSGIEKLSLAKNIQLPEFYNFCLFRIKLDEDSDGNKKKLIDMMQHIFEWELPNNFTHNQLNVLVKNIRNIISDLRSSGEPKRFDHPIQTRLGTKNYTGYFSGSRGFENTHIIDITPTDKDGKRVLRFATEMGQDTVLYVMLQISYFIKNGELLPSTQLWREIYAMYNQLSMEGVERFDPSALKSQYNTLVQKVVWPLSREHKELKGTIGKPHNALLYGVYGTGKSQLLTHLLAERKYTLINNKGIHLEANVINIGIVEFAELLIKSVSGFRKRLSDIHENTGLPIIIVIEDIDTIIKEAGLDSDPVSQAMTTLFEGVGSLPVTVIASTNNPEILPQRHLRPNRLDTLIDFPYPINIESLRSILRSHWDKRDFQKRFSDILTLDEIEDKILQKIKDFTPSHISALCLAIYEAIEFLDISQMTKDELKGIIFMEIENCLVPVQDMNNRESGMKKWRDSLGSKGGTMGFLSNTQKK